MKDNAIILPNPLFAICKMKALSDRNWLHFTESELKRWMLITNSWVRTYCKDSLM